MTAPGVRVAVGVSGAGKTYGVRRQVFEAARSLPVIVIDQMAEWNEAPRDIKRSGWEMPDKTQLPAIVEYIEREIARGNRLIVLRGGDEHLSALAAASVALKRGSASSRFNTDDRSEAITGIAIPEAHHIFPSGGKLAKPLLRIATQWRHFRVALWCDTQRFALLSRTVEQQATRELRLYAIVGDRDLSVVRDVGGRELADAVAEAGRRLDSPEHGGLGEAGWHVRLGLTRRPPYTLHRDPP